jgi:hypothetical protein
MSSADANRFAKLTYEDFRRMAVDPSLSKYEKVGFPDAYRRGQEAAIFADIVRKVPALGERGKTLMDIGPGCSDLPGMILERCRTNDHRLVLVDAPEMLALLPDAPFVEKVPARFPDAPALLARYAGAVDGIVAYSVFHHVFTDGDAWGFVDRALGLLAPGGTMLLGDVPNVSKRRRFFLSAAGVKYHQDHTNSTEVPEVRFNELVPQQIDDSVLVGILLRARAQGVDAYLVPQAPELPMSNRREDLVFHKP